MSKLVDTPLQILLLSILISKQLKMPLMLLANLILMVGSLSIFKPNLPPKRLYIALRIIVEKDRRHSILLTHCALPRGVNHTLTRNSVFLSQSLTLRPQIQRLRVSQITSIVWTFRGAWNVQTILVLLCKWSGSRIVVLLHRSLALMQRLRLQLRHIMSCFPFMMR